MAKFNEGDRIRIPKDTQGANVEWFGREGTIVKLAGQESSGSVPIVQPPMQWEPMYQIEWDDIQEPALIKESWLEFVD